MVYIVGAGSGAPDLITVRGDRLLREADIVVYAGSLVNPALLEVCKPDCVIHDSARMTLEQVIDVLADGVAKSLTVVRLHTGDPSLYGAIQEQLDALVQRNIACEIVPGVSSFLGAAASLQAEYTLPGVSQTLILTRMEGRTPVPETERIAGLASHGASMAIFLSAGLLEGLRDQLLAGAYEASTPAAIVYKATWPDEKIFRCTVGALPETARDNGITKTALILVGSFLDSDYERSKLYDPAFTTGYRKGTD